MKKTTFGPMFLAVIVAILIITIPNQWLTPLVTNRTARHQSSSLSPAIFQGITVQRQVMKDPTIIPIYGSSELSRFDEFHPSNYFKVYDPKYTPFLIGRGGTQSLIHFLSLSANYSSLKGKQIIFIISPQWFNKRGLDEQRFDPNFSKLQAIEFAKNNKIPMDIKERAINRLLDYSIVRNDKMLSTLMRQALRMKPEKLSNKLITQNLVNPYLSIINKQDVLTSKFNFISNFERNYYSTSKNKSYKELIAIAEKEGKKTATNNPFYIRNSIYTLHFANKINQLKNSKSTLSYKESPEYKDLQLELDLLKSAGAKPLFISVPVNGYFYDYIGFKKEERTLYYKKVSKEIRDAGFEVEDLSNHEYDKYFFRDSLHLSLKGWVYVDQAMESFLHNKEIVKNKSQNLVIN
ncbi:D-alanyl-lipoteichoic acid biosynthesis protein DltD [Gottfriedia sp. NPDC058432]|uniref:D-alanyl-lipoteichoic acid biosynthesis protein DltD n=1 Tax=Gottfriedia sp. NPDC058432 TaxID=3346497 RepID=UPI00365796A6